MIRTPSLALAGELWGVYHEYWGKIYFHRQSIVLFISSKYLLLADPPGPPSAPVPSEVNSTSCVLTWEGPEDDGGSPVTGYFVERCQAGSTRWLRVNREPVTEKTLKVTELIEDNEYEFRVVAINKIGEGPPGDKCSPPIKAKDPWRKFREMVQLGYRHHYLLSKFPFEVLIWILLKVRICAGWTLL